MTALPFALNHMAAPALPVDAFFSLAKSLGISMVEIRNDLAGNAIADGTPPEEVKALAEKHGLTIVSINALQRFNEWNEQRADEARELISYARDCGAKALVLVPVNDGSGKEDGVRQSNLRQALGALKPMLD
ncbi:TIM barrel protein, partial [Sinorhizobium meliloti]